MGKVSLVMVTSQVVEVSAPKIFGFGIMDTLLEIIPAN